MNVMVFTYESCMLRKVNIVQVCFAMCEYPLLASSKMLEQLLEKKISFIVKKRRVKYL